MTCCFFFSSIIIFQEQKKKKNFFDLHAMYQKVTRQKPWFEMIEKKQMNMQPFEQDSYHRIPILVLGGGDLTNVNSFEKQPIFQNKKQHSTF